MQEIFSDVLVLKSALSEMKADTDIVPSKKSTLESLGTFAHYGHFWALLGSLGTFGHSGVLWVLWALLGTLCTFGRSGHFWHSGHF